MKLKSGLGAFCAIQSGNGSGLFYNSWDPCRALVRWPWIGSVRASLALASLS